MFEIVKSGSSLVLQFGEDDHLWQCKDARAVEMGKEIIRCTDEIDELYLWHQDMEDLMEPWFDERRETALFLRDLITDLLGEDAAEWIANYFLLKDLPADWGNCPECLQTSSHKSGCPYQEEETPE